MDAHHADAHGRADIRGDALSLEGERVIGTVSSDNEERDIENGSVQGEEISWVVRKAVMGMDLRFVVVSAGDELAGTAKLGVLGTASVRGVRSGPSRDPARDNG